MSPSKGHNYQGQPEPTLEQHQIKEVDLQHHPTHLCKLNLTKSRNCPISTTLVRQATTCLWKLYLRFCGAPTQTISPT